MLNSIDWTCLGLYKTSQLMVRSEQMRVVRLKELLEELRDRIMARLLKNCCIKVPKSSAASIILKRRKFETNRTVAGGLAKLSFQGKRL